MRALKIIVATFVTVIAIPSGAAWAKAPEGAKVDAKLERCTGSSVSVRRALTMRASMSTENREVAMRMRFQLYEKTSGGEWQDVTPSNLQKWMEKPAGVDEFKSRFRVRSLSAPARYRAVVNYEWLDKGQSVGEKRKTTNSCRIRSKQPDLVAKSAMIRPGTDDQTWSYVFLVSNQGTRAARGFNMEIRIGGGTVIKKSVKSLRPKRSYRLEVVDRRCSEAQIEGFVDTDDDVTEGNEKNNSVKVNCPQS